MKEVKVRRVGEELFELKLPKWCWYHGPYVTDGLRQIIACGEFPFYVYRRDSFKATIYMVATIPIDKLKA